jgi:hypothetical protein
MLFHLAFSVAGLLLAVVVAAAAEQLVAHPGSMARRVIGLLGFLILLAVLLYPLRKRKIIRWGAMRRWLEVHEALGMAGPLITLVHSGLHLHNPIAVLAEVLALVTMFSGFAGRSLHQEVKSGLSGLRAELKAQGLSPDEIEERLVLVAGASTLLSRWRMVHYPLTAALYTAALFHIVGVFYYGGVF